MGSQADEHERLVREWGLVNLVGLVFVLAFAGIHVYHGVTTESLGDPGEIRSLGIGLVYLAGLAVYFTPYWHPVLFLVWAIFTGALTVFSVLQRPTFPLFELVRVLLGAILVVLLLYFFYREQVTYER